MQKVLLRVYGPEGSGKTTAINSAFDKFKERYPNAKCVLRCQKDGHGDILVAVKVMGIYVGFSSHGDDPVEIKKNLCDLREKKCDIIVCATRFSGKTKKAVEKFNEEFDDEYCIEPYRPQRNNDDADAIVKFIDDHIANNS